eukprot:15200807-Alexandrium_andersonii.AAC.1
MPINKANVVGIRKSFYPKPAKGASSRSKDCQGRKCLSWPLSDPSPGRSGIHKIGPRAFAPGAA